jgi:glycine/D-amino acid oxidase-like deaminating enzyme
MASGHYRNGVLLAPASAEWVAEVISKPAEMSDHS